MDKIAVLDFGGQYAHLIANRIRRLKVYSEILEGDTRADKLKGYKGLILSGGPQSVYEKNAPNCDKNIFKLGIPILGICYGHQLISYVRGGQIKPGKEYGFATFKPTKKEGVLKRISDKETVWMSHGDSVTVLPKGMENLGSTDDCKIAAAADFKNKIFSIQFHAEVTHTTCGMKILDNFLNICKCKRNWNLKNFTAQKIKEIKRRVGNKKVFLLISGGVDSTVTSLLLDKALGQKNVYGLFVDTGFMRLNERKEVESALKKIGIKNLHVYNAEKEFFKALKNVYDPEEKRKIIGELFVKIQQKVVKKLKLNPEEWLLGQGTIYPDTIESGRTKHADKIKTHHNRVKEIEELIAQGKVIEPLEQLYKDEVRETGRTLGLSEKLISRHPFPGPGLAVRCLCAKKEIIPENKKKLEKNIENFLKHHSPIQAKILPIQSVGVQGDARTYRHPVAIFCKFPGWKILSEISTSITNKFKEINRVLYCFSPSAKKEVKFTLKKCALEKSRIKLLQKADKIVMDFIYENRLEKEIWQFPTVLIPVSISGKKESIVLRPVSSLEAMTANFYQMEPELIKNLVHKLQKLSGISAIFYDLTNKPPATIEWE